MRKYLDSKIASIFFPIKINMCFGCSKEPFHLSESSEYTQHMFLLRNQKTTTFFSIMHCYLEDWGSL